MAWGLEARVPFLDKTFLDVSMNVDPKQKMFSKGSTQELDQDGRPLMEKVYIYIIFSSRMIHVHFN
jgi:asparagine synthase (glutamine-hydrolysing)